MTLGSKRTSEIISSVPKDVLKNEHIGRLYADVFSAVMMRKLGGEFGMAAGKADQCSFERSVDPEQVEMHLER
jgi:hypothetical protein